MRVWGKIGECSIMPKVIMPLVVEASKHRLCHDERFLNLWIKDVPFKLETLKFAHRLISEGAVWLRAMKSPGTITLSFRKSQTMYNAKSNNAIGCRGKKATFMSR